MTATNKPTHTHGYQVAGDGDDGGPALAFANSPRGQLIISQALHYGILALEAQDEARREESNLADMHYLFARAFPVYGLTAGLSAGLLRAVEAAVDLEEREAGEEEEEARPSCFPRMPEEQGGGA